MNKSHLSPLLQKPQVAVAISSYRSGSAVCRILNTITEERWPVARVIVVDSLGRDEAMFRSAATGLPCGFEYWNSPVNLGAAGNLYRRLELAAELGMDFVLALNHDAVVSKQAVEALLEHSLMEKLGALYPLRFREGKGKYDLTGMTDFAFRFRGESKAPDATLVEVSWGSSNGALYAVPAFLSGVRPDRSLWHGWEDYAFGLALHKAGYKQYIVSAAKTLDNYEYKTVTALGGAMVLADKPAWTIYYTVRNRLLVNFHRERHLLRAAKTLIWCALMLAPLLALRRSRAQRWSDLRAYLTGVRDGLQNQAGKWELPTDPVPSATRSEPMN